MPRRNENARSRGPAVNDLWRLADLKAMSEHIDKKVVLRQIQEGRRQKATIFKTTGESIVRDHRNSVANLIEMPSVQRVYKAAWYRAINLDTVFDWTCAIMACIAIAVIFGLIVFGPSTVREFWK